jgi:hypothetical protein
MEEEVDDELEVNAKYYAWMPDVSILQSVASAPILRMFGCAGWGCSFLLNNGRAFKVTTDDDEAKAVELFIDLRQEKSPIPGIVDIFKAPMVIGKFPWKDRTRTKIYVYEREVVEPLEDDGRKYTFGFPVDRKRHLYDEHPTMTLFDVLNEMAGNLINLLTTKPKSKERDKREKEMRTRIRNLMRELRNMLLTDEIDPDIADIVDTIDEVYAQGFILADFGANNIGMTQNGKLKLFDFQILAK